MLISIRGPVRSAAQLGGHHVTVSSFIIGWNTWIMILYVKYNNKSWLLQSWVRNGMILGTKWYGTKRFGHEMTRNRGYQLNSKIYKEEEECTVVGKWQWPGWESFAHPLFNFKHTATSVLSVTLSWFCLYTINVCIQSVNKPKKLLTKIFFLVTSLPCACAQLVTSCDSFHSDARLIPGCYTNRIFAFISGCVYWICILTHLLYKVKVKITLLCLIHFYIYISLKYNKV